MRINNLYKRICLTTILVLISFFTFGQATLPFAYDSGNPGTAITGLTQSGLGNDYGTSPKMKFDTQGANLILNFSGVPGTLSFKIKWNQSTTLSRFPGDFTLQESADGTTYTTVRLYNATNGTALSNGSVVTESVTTLLSATRYLKWIYTSKSNGNIGIGAISLTAGNSSILNISTNTLSGFGYVAGSGPSAEKSFTVSGSSLTNNISITPPSDYEVSIGSGASFVAINPITLTQAGGIVNTTTIYSRLKSGLISGTYNENITVAVIGGNSSPVACTGTVTANPSIVLTDVTDPTLNTVQGSPVSQTINVSGVNLSMDLGLAISGTDASLFSLSNYTVTETGGNVPNTLVTITYTPNAVGTNTAYLTMSSTGAMPVIRTLNGIASVNTGLDDLKTTLVVTSQNGNVLFNTSAGETVEIYNSIGQQLVRKQTMEGVNTIPVAVRGVILVKIGSKVAKVIM
ncbi:MAG: hypothetical protein PHT07_03250 [Paludibacter sp.]|nr:hypothetical protein [Paludibacter sp.]